MNEQDNLLVVQALGACLVQLQRLNYMDDKQVYKSIHMSPNTYTALKGAPIRKCTSMPAH